MSKVVGKRINIGVSEDLNDRLEKISKMYGMSKSSLCAYFIGQSVAAVELTYQRVETIGLEDIKNMMSGYVDENSKIMEDKKG